MIKDILFYALTLFTGIVMGFGYARWFYTKKINKMNEINAALMARVKKAEDFLLRDILQFTPEDIKMINDKTGELGSKKE